MEAQARGAACLAVLCLAWSVLPEVMSEQEEILFPNHRSAAWSLIRNGFQNNLSHIIVDQLLDFYIPSSKTVENERCLSDGQKVRAAIKNSEPWALKMLDASSKVPSGLLMGDTVQLGNYDECMSVRSTTVNGTAEPFFGQFCMLKLLYLFDDTDNSSDIINNETTKSLMVDFAFALGSEFSVCIPSSCTPSDLEVHLESVLSDIGDFKVWMPLDSCQTRANPSTLSLGDWSTMILLVVFAVIVLLSTVYDLKSESFKSRANLFTAFSVYTNGRQLLHVAPDSGELKALHAIRTISMLWVVIGHTFHLHETSIPATNNMLYSNILYNWQHAFLMNYDLAVDVFLLLSGLLVCYGFLRKVKRGKSFNIISYYFHRYIRLTPAYAVVVFLTATLLQHTDDGPIWEQRQAYDKISCANNWWSNLLYINNYVHQLTYCMPQSWYLSVDMQLYVFSPLLLYPLWRWRRLGKIILASVAVTGLLINFLLSFIHKLYSRHIRTDEEVDLLQYSSTHTRFTPWVAGVALGVLLHSGRARGRPAHLGRAAVLLGWGASCLLIIGPILVNHRLNLPTYVYNRWEQAFNSALNRPAFALGVAWIIFACNNGYGGIVNSFFSLKIFTILSRLTYCTYLVHLAVIVWIALSIKTPIYLSDKELIMKTMNVVVISFAAAIVLSLVFEVPALKIEKLFLEKRVATENKNTTSHKEEGNQNNATQETELNIV